MRGWRDAASQRRARVLSAARALTATEVASVERLLAGAPEIAAFSREILRQDRHELRAGVPSDPLSDVEWHWFNPGGQVRFLTRRSCGVSASDSRPFSSGL